MVFSCKIIYEILYPIIWLGKRCPLKLTLDEFQYFYILKGCEFLDRENVTVSWQNSIIYLIGITIVGFGVVAIIRSNFGAGPWDTVNYNLSELVGITLGTASVLVNVVITSIIIAYRKKIKFLFMIFPILAIGISIDFWDILVFGDFSTSNLLLQSGLFIVGFGLLPLGLALVISTKYPAFVFDELMMMLMDITKITNIGKIRISIEMFAIIFASILGFAGGIGFGAVNFGSVFMALTIGLLINYYLNLILNNKDIVDSIYKHAINFTFYFVGGITIAFGVVLLIRSELGVSSWDTMHYSLSMLTGITLGQATIVVAAVVTAFVTIANRSLKYLFMTIPILFVGWTIDLFNLHIVLNTFEPEGYERFIGFVTGLLLLPMGGSMLIISTYPAGVFDEFNLTLMRMFKTKNLFKVRVIMEFSAVLVALTFGLMAGIGLGAINIGTVIFSVSVGYLIKLNLKFYSKMGRHYKI